jgi:oligopeptide transport system substrate-binding protein
MSDRATISHALTMLLALATASSACQGSDWGERAPLKAAAPPAQVPEASSLPTQLTTPSAPAEARLRLHGEDVYPCEGHASCERPSPEDGTLSFALGGAEHIDPTLVSESAGHEVCQNIFESLLAPPVGEGALVPGVATRYDLSRDKLRYTFHLRKDAKWSNGRAVTAHDFVYAWTRKLHPETASQSAEHHFFIKNAERFNAGELKDASKLGFRATDDWTLEVELKVPTPFWPHYVKTCHYAPVPREAIKAHGHRWTRPENIVTNGPYHLTVWRPRDRMALTRSETYWDRESVAIPSVRIYASDSIENDLRRYEIGQTQWTLSSVTPDKMTVYVRDRRPDLFVDAYLSVYFYAFRVDRPPFDNVLIRRAFNMAIDKERLVKDITRGMQVPADGLVPPFFAQTMNYPRPAGDSFDPEGARRLLAEAGYPNGVGLPPVDLIYNTYESHRLIAEFIQRSLKENLGLTVTIGNMEWKSLLKRLRAGDFQVSRYGWVGLPDPHSFLKLLRVNSTNNITGYKNPEIDRLLDASLTATSEAHRLKLLAQAEAIIQRDVPIAPLYYYTMAYLKAPVLRGIEPELNNTHLLKYMYWGDKERTR